MCSCVYRSRDKQNYKQRRAVIKSRWEVVAQTTKHSHREAVGVGLAYIRIKRRCMNCFWTLRKSSGLYRNVQVVRLRRGGVGSTRLLPPFFTQTHTLCSHLGISVVTVTANINVCEVRGLTRHEPKQKSV